MVKLRKNFKTGEVETFDSLLKRWRTEVNNAGILKEYRIHEHYMSRKERRAEKMARNQKRMRRQK